MMATVTKQKFLIILSNIPSNYCIEDIIRHLPSKTKSITNNRIEKIRKSIIAIKIIQNKCFIIYSSIYQWLKHGRFMLNHELNGAIHVNVHPQYLFNSAQNSSNVEFSVLSGNKIINLMHMMETSYIFKQENDNNIYISFKKDKEYLIKLDQINENVMINHIESTNQMSIILNKRMVLYEYQHRHQYTLCEYCHSVNTKDSTKCVACDRKLEESLDYLLHKMKFLKIKPNLKCNEIIFINQSRFYQESTSWNMTEMKLLYPLHCIMQQQQNIKTMPMFTNYIKFKFDRLSKQQFMHFIMQQYPQFDMKSENEYSEYTSAFDFKEIQNTIEWLQSEIGAKYVFPIFEKLFDFKNPALFADIDVLKNYKCEIEEAFVTNGIPSWIIQEVIMKCKRFDVDELRAMIEDTDEKYEAQGLDVCDEDAKENYFQIKISRFAINIDIIDHEELKKYTNFVQFREIRRNIYITTFNNQVYRAYDPFKNIRNIMNFKGFQVIGQNKSDLFLRLNDDNGSYISTVCDKYFTYDIFRDKYKQIDYFKDIEDNDNDIDIYHEMAPIFNDLNHDDIDTKHREPPIKKRKINGIKTQNIYIKHLKNEEQNDITDSTSLNVDNASFPPKMEYTDSESPKTEKNIEEKDESKDVKYFHGVPIYNEWYYDCGVFPEYGSEEFPLKDFALKCISTACRSDLHCTSGLGSLRNIGNRPRNRSVKKPDEAEAAFFNIPDNDYQDIFRDCFTTDSAIRMDINLNKWNNKCNPEKKRRRKYIIYLKNHYIDKEQVNTLMTLLNLYAKYNSKGILYLNEYPPPWYKSATDLVAEFLKLDVNVIDLTNMECDESNYGNQFKDTKMMNECNKEIGVKMECDYDRYSDSEYDS